MFQRLAMVSLAAVVIGAFTQVVHTLMEDLRRKDRDKTHTTKMFGDDNGRWR